MTRHRILALLLALGFVALTGGCTTTHSNSNARSEGGYYRRGSVHNQSFPANYVPGRHRSWGSVGRYGW